MSYKNTREKLRCYMELKELRGLKKGAMSNSDIAKEIDLPEKQLRLHVAILPSIRALVDSGITDQVIKIRAHYSTTISTNYENVDGSIFSQKMTEYRRIVYIDWNVEKTGKSLTLLQIYQEMQKNKIPDMILDKLSLAIPTVQFNNNTLKNETVYKEWSFEPYTFRKGFWKRLKATNFPAKKLYKLYNDKKADIIAKLDTETKKRWRDTLLMNAPHDELTNQELRVIWQNKLTWALLLKESRGSFDLMDLKTYT